MLTQKHTNKYIIPWKTYMHIFLLFPVLIYVLVSCFSDSRPSHQVKFLIALATIIIIISHMQDAMWLNLEPYFFRKNNDVISAFKRTRKIQIILCLVLSILIYYILLR